MHDLVARVLRLGVGVVDVVDLDVTSGATGALASWVRNVSCAAAFPGAAYVTTHP